MIHQICMLTKKKHPPTLASLHVLRTCDTQVFQETSVSIAQAGKHNEVLWTDR